jgi:phytanoyl-CoA hydroxylase
MIKKATSGRGTTQFVPFKDGYMDEHGIEPHDPDLYRHDSIAALVEGFDQVGEDDVSHFGRHGWLAIDHAFSPEEIASAVDGFQHLASGLHPDYDRIQYEAEARDRIDSLGVEERQDAVRKLGSFVDFEPRLQSLASHPKLLEIVARIVGTPDLNMFQDMALVKPPRIGREKPWHQDCAYFNIPPDTPVVGVWIALDEVTLENGCMHVLDYGHQAGPQIHFLRRDWQICDTDTKDLHQGEHPIVAVPLAPGGCLLFSGLLPHGTPQNHTDQRRRALQFHYRPAATVETSEEERLEVFGSEGKDIEC